MILMIVPTIHTKQPRNDSKTQKTLADAHGLRLSLTGLRLLERYSMTELGMVLTNPLHGPWICRKYLSECMRTLGGPPLSYRITKRRKASFASKKPDHFCDYWKSPTAKVFGSDRSSDR